MTSLQLPILDVSQPLTLPCTLSSLSKACKDWGFFHIKNHGISKELYERLYAVSNEAFSLPFDTKIKIGPSSTVNTYTPHFIASPFFESLRVSGPNYYDSAKSSTDVLFDLPNTEFCDAVEEYGSIMMDLCKKIMSAVLNCLGDDYETKYYQSEFATCHGYLRINSYSPPETIGTPEITEGLGMHTDMSCITILYQDEVGGLQVRSKEGEWMDISPNEGTLVVNIGDLLQAWSNGLLRSSEHRVILKRPVSRFSLAFFWCFDDDKEVSAPDDVVGKWRRVYRPFLCKDYIRFRESSEKGRFEKVGYTVDDFAVSTSTQAKEVDPRRTVSL